MNFHLAGNLVAQQIRDSKIDQVPISTKDQRKNNRRKLNSREVDAIERLYRESNIVAAAVDQICDDIESGYLAIDSDPTEAIREGSKPQSSESTAYKSLLMKLGVEFCRAILLYRMCVVAIPRTKEAPFIAPLSEYHIEFEQLVAGGRWYYVSHRLSDKERFKDEPLYFLAIANEPDIRGSLNSPMVRLIEDFNMVAIKRAMSMATDLSNLVPPVYGIKDVKDQKTEDAVPGFTMGDEKKRLDEEEEEAKRLKKAELSGAINIPPAAPLVPFSELLSKVIHYEGDKSVLEKLVGLLESNTFKSATIIHTEEEKLVPAGRPAQVNWIEDQEQFVQLVAMATKYPSDLWNSAYTKVSSAAENSREKKKNCLRSNIHKVEQFLEFLVNEEYNRVIDRFNETFAEKDPNRVLTMPVNGGIGSSGDKPIPPRVDPVGGSHAYEFGAAGHLPLAGGQEGPSEINPDVPMKQHEDLIETDVFGADKDKSSTKKNSKTVRIILPINKDELVELDTMGRVDGKTMQFMLAAQYGGSPEWFNEEVKLPVPPAPEEPGAGKRKKPSSGSAAAKKKKKAKSKSKTSSKTRPKRPTSSSKSKGKSKTVKASKEAAGPPYRYFDEETSWVSASSEEDGEESDEEEGEEILLEHLSIPSLPLPPPPASTGNPLPLPSNHVELAMNRLLQQGMT